MVLDDDVVDDVVCHPAPFRTEALFLPAAGKVGRDDSQLSPLPGNTLFRKKQPHPSLPSLSRGSPITGPRRDIKALILASKHNSSAGAPSSGELHRESAEILVETAWQTPSTRSCCLQSLTGVSESTPQQNFIS